MKKCIIWMKDIGEPVAGFKHYLFWDGNHYAKVYTIPKAKELIIKSVKYRQECEGKKENYLICPCR